jgi:hypothetical protein
VALKDITQIK